MTRPAALVQSLARMGHDTQGNPECSLLYYIIKNTIKETNERPDKVVYRMEAGSVPSAGASVLMELGCSTLPTPRCVHQTHLHVKPILEALQTLYLGDFYGRSIM